MKRGRQIKNKGPKVCNLFGFKPRQRDGVRLPCQCGQCRKAK